MKHKITIINSGEEYDCSEQESVLSGMARLGHKGIPVGCRGGGCGVCIIRVVQGQYEARKMSAAHISAEDLREQRVLACRISPQSDLEIMVEGKIERKLSRNCQ